MVGARKAGVGSGSRAGETGTGTDTDRGYMLGESEGLCLRTVVDTLDCPYLNIT